MRINLLVGGPVESWPEDLLEGRGEDEAWVGADKGAVRLCEAGIRPLLSIGDFDSSTNRERYLVGVMSREVLTSVPEKDDTDTELCLRLIEERFHPEQITVYGATGGRIDHLLANLFCLLRPDFHSLLPKVEFVDECNVIRFYHPGSYEIRRIEGMRYLAFVSMGPVLDLNLYDEKYRLRHADIPRVISLASNEFMSSVAHFSFAGGNVCVIWSRDRTR